MPQFPPGQETQCHERFLLIIYKLFNNTWKNQSLGNYPRKMFRTVPKVQTSKAYPSVWKVEKFQVIKVIYRNLFIHAQSRSKTKSNSRSKTFVEQIQKHLKDDQKDEKNLKREQRKYFWFLKFEVSSE